MTMAAAIAPPRLHHVRPTTVDSTTATSTPATTLSTRRTPVVSVENSVACTTSRAVSGPVSGCGVSNTARATRYDSTAATVSRDVRMTIGRARRRRACSESGRTRMLSTVRRVRPSRHHTRARPDSGGAGHRLSIRTTVPLPAGFPWSSMGAMVAAYRWPSPHSTASAPGRSRYGVTWPFLIIEIRPPNSSAT